MILSYRRTQVKKIEVAQQKISVAPHSNPKNNRRPDQERRKGLFIWMLSPLKFL